MVNNSNFSGGGPSVTCATPMRNLATRVCGPPRGLQVSDMSLTCKKSQNLVLGIRLQVSDMSLTCKEIANFWQNFGKIYKKFRCGSRRG